jgi:multiple sugar transport system substrate-binding protein
MRKRTCFKALLTGVLVILLVLSSLIGCANKDTDSQNDKGSADSNSISGTVNIWTWQDKEAEQVMIDEFNKDFPDIKIEITNVAPEDMVKKLQTALAADSELPDIAWMEIAYRGRLISLDCWENLENYGVDRNNILDFLIPLSVNERDELVGIEVSPAFAGMAYKRDLAKEYFGTDDPDELTEILSDWDTMIQKGVEIKEKSNGEVFLFTGVDEVISILKGQDNTPFIKDGDVLNVREALEPIFSRAIEMVQLGIVDRIQSWTPAWNASYAASNHIFYTCATWSPTWVIKANDKDSTGRWGLMVPPGGAIASGGTIVGIPKKAKNKEAAFEYIKWNYLTEKGAIANRDNNEYFNTMKSTYEDPNFYSKPDPYFGGQDILKTFAQVIGPNMAPSRPVCEYDQEISDALKLAVTTINSLTDTSISVDDILDDVETAIIEKVPELKR